MTELSHFEQLSAKTPKKEPYAILLGTIFAIFVLWLVNTLAPSEGVKDLREQQTQKDAPAAVRADDIDDI